MLLSGTQIASRITGDGENRIEADLVVRPLPDLKKLASVSSASVDLRLGSWFATMRQSRTSILSTDDEAALIASRASLTPVQLDLLHLHLPTAFSATEAMISKAHYVPFGRPFVLHPHNFVLGVTLEWIRLPANLAGYVIGRSCWGRRGLIIATAVGVHPGFTGCLTLELSNVGEIPIAIKPGVQICQLFLHTVQGVGAPSSASPFSCTRRPTVGVIELDSVAQKLAKYSS